MVIQNLLVLGHFFLSSLAPQQHHHLLVDHTDLPKLKLDYSVREYFSYSIKHSSFCSFQDAYFIKFYSKHTDECREREANWELQLSQSLKPSLPALPWSFSTMGMETSFIPLLGTLPCAWEFLAGVKDGVLKLGGSDHDLSVSCSSHAQWIGSLLGTITNSQNLEQHLNQWFTTTKPQRPGVSRYPFKGASWCHSMLSCFGVQTWFTR